MDHDHPWSARTSISLLVIGAVLGYFLLTEHLEHALGALPFILLLACPLMHLFMHHGHDAHTHHDAKKPSKSEDPDSQ